MKVSIQDTYPEDFANCFGCGRNNEHGHKIKTFPDGERTVTDHEPAPYFLGGGTSAYGGFIASLIDCHAAGSAAIFWMQANGRAVGDEPSPRFVTARLEVDYITPTPLAPMHLTGVAEEIGDRKVIVATELVAEGQITARGRAVMVRVRSR
ncbi:MAG: PaaI family thioesterase [bacterium]|nr:PaaI family thioesterase [bacterium]